MKRYRDEELILDEKLDEHGRLVERVWLDPENLLPHREFGAAKQVFDPKSGRLTCEIWINQYQHGRHRAGNLPSEVSIDPKSGVVVIELYEQNDRLHRDDGGPTKILRDAISGDVTFLEYRWDGLLHRYQGQPTVQEFCPTSGDLIHEEYHVDGVLHREDGPAAVSYDDFGRAIPDSLQYFTHGNSTEQENLQPPNLL